MVQNFCCCWCLVLLVTVGRSALRFGTRSGRSVPIHQATDDYSTAGLYYGAVQYYSTTQSIYYVLHSSSKPFVASKPGSESTTTLRSDCSSLSRQQYIRVRLYWSYTRRRTATAHSSSSRRWRRRCCCWSYSQCRSCMHGSGSEPLPFRWQQLQPCLHNSYYYQTTTTTPTASRVSR